LAITGTSAGGVFVGRAVTERPDLFVAAISRVADSNSLRSEIMAGGPANIPEFGTVQDPQGFKNLFAMDSYQHVKDGTAYPAWLLTTGLHDPRVAPWQAGKMAARLQAAGGRAPVLLRVEEESGHGMGTTRSTRDAEEADIAAFIFWRSGLKDWQPLVPKP
jgi:prolyl oligopeptidase